MRVGRSVSPSYETMVTESERGWGLEAREEPSREEEGPFFVRQKRVEYKFFKPRVSRKYKAWGPSARAVLRAKNKGGY